jgi:hypothetical protein
MDDFSTLHFAAAAERLTASEPKVRETLSNDDANATTRAAQCRVPVAR